MLVPYGVKEVQAHDNKLIIDFKNKESKLGFMTENRLEPESFLKRVMAPSRLEIAKKSDISRILDSYAKMDITQIFPAPEFSELKV